MFHAPVSDSKQKADAAKAKPPPRKPDAYPAFDGSHTLGMPPVLGRSLSPPAPVSPRKQQPARLQRACGNQGRLRMLARSKSLSQILPPHPEEARRAVSKDRGAVSKAPSCFETAASPPPQHEGFGSVQAFETGAKQTIQRKLVVNEPGDAYEQEADRVADQVMRMPDAEPFIAPAPAQLSRKCAACEEEDKTKMLQTKPAGSAEAATGEAPPIVHEVLRSPGQPLDGTSRAFFEPRFGQDFSRVRAHTDRQAEQSALAVNSFGYTVGRNIVFAPGRYAPSTYDGTRLLAHELTQVMQQQGTDRPALSAEWKIPGVQLHRQDDGSDDAAAAAEQPALVAQSPDLQQTQQD